VSTVGKQKAALKRSTVGRGFRIAVVVSRFHKGITDKLRLGALQCLGQQGVRREDVEVFSCPGAFELPQVANLLCGSGNFDAVVCLGAVVRGETPHFKYVSSEAARGIQEVALRYALPVTFGVLTTDNLEQALERAGGSQGNKGWDAARAAVEMANLFRKLKRRSARMPMHEG
jgi:6,7-dimethyl-8-ribityllumazine synthase